MFDFRIRRASLLAGLLLGVAALPCLAAQAVLPAQVATVQDRWAQINYNTPKKQRESGFEALAKQAATVRAAQPGNASALIWEGIVLSSFAGERGGLGALSLVKQAKKDFEQALAIDPKALDGAAYTSLGALYYQVPGWPIGFGDDAKARELLKAGLQVDPDGIDANYFYGDYLQDQGDWKAAAASLEKALAAPARPGRELADQGRRKDIQALLTKVRSHLASR
ncbi:hypothetical protein ASE35_07955 [Lysobacter sp. Root916]|uniref:hypothetical protein n=1 Tax=Lysobacter sp. Root916 TaxID=1736606 RepID=UPI00070BDF77|nr:hypothetical protein ASE35_07955 [Lysobacter sp. Root916]